MSVSGVLRRGRRAFEKRMRATCTIGRPDLTKPQTDPTTGKVTYPESPVYAGRCYIRYPGLAFEQNAESGGAVAVVSRNVVRIPFGVVVRPGDVVTITADPDNPQMVDTRLRVASIDDQSQATAQRLVCDDVQAGPQNT